MISRMHTQFGGTLAVAFGDTRTCSTRNVWHPMSPSGLRSPGASPIRSSHGPRSESQNWCQNATPSVWFQNVASRRNLSICCWSYWYSAASCWACALRLSSGSCVVGVIWKPGRWSVIICKRWSNALSTILYTTRAVSRGRAGSRHGPSPFALIHCWPARNRRLRSTKCKCIATASRRDSHWPCTHVAHACISSAVCSSAPGKSAP